MTGKSIPPVGPPKCTVTVESNEVYVTVRAALSPQDVRDLIDALWGALATAEGRQSAVSQAFRDHENMLDHERAERNVGH
jgi:hypothetical protein